MIETLALSAALVAAVTSLLGIMYFGFVHIGANYLLHEFLVCESTVGEQHCEKNFRWKAESFLFAARVLTLESRAFGGKHGARLVLAMPLKRTLTLKKEF